MAVLMMWVAGPPYCGERAVLATMHGKEQVIAPLALRFLGLHVELAQGLDTDSFGTFSREIDRAGSQIEAARAKIAAAFARSPEAHIGLASEGSFGPHPYLPFLPICREIVVLIDRSSGLELVGYHAGSETNFSHAVVDDVDAGRRFAERIGFPGHGIIVMGCKEGKPVPELALIKNATTWETLDQAIHSVLDGRPTAFVEADMRAHRNPKRMRAIKRAMIDLVRRALSQCPDCDRPGFSMTDRLVGLPCSWCRQPTLLTMAEIWMCVGCGYRQERPVAAAAADPGNCDGCNP